MDKNEIVCSYCANAAETQVQGRVWCKEWQRYMPEDGYCFKGNGIQINVYDKEEIHHNCTVQVLHNTATGKVSVGWWENEEGVE